LWQLAATTLHGHAKVRQLPNLWILFNGFYFSVTDIHDLYQWL